MSSSEDIVLPLLAFNDVYRVHQKYNAPAGHAARNASGGDPAQGSGANTPLPSVPKPNLISPNNASHLTPPSGTSTPTPTPSAKKEQQYLTVGQFAHTLLSIRSSWKDRHPSKTSTVTSEEENDNAYEPNDDKDGLVLFAGDVFNPSVESSVTRGSHMVPVMRELKLDASCVGNHDCDFSFGHLERLIEDTKFPWMMSNIIDENTKNVPRGTERFVIKERCGLKIGIIGLVEEDWIATIPSWPPNFKYRSMAQVAVELSTELRDPNGKYQVDLIIALTHCRLPNDINLANEVGAVVNSDPSKHGVDLIIGGHDHMYYIGRGAQDWDGFRGDYSQRGIDKDKSTCIIKSGTDFRDLSEAHLTLSPSPPSSIRKRTITSISGIHHEITPETPTSHEIDNLVKSLLSTVNATLTKAVCFTLTPFDARSEKVRTEETAVGNWVADILMHAYAERPQQQGEAEAGKEGKEGESGKEGKEKEGGEDVDADCVILCGGTFRGDSLYPPGKVTLGDILEILPFDDPVVCLELDGQGIHDVLESALSKWPAQEGRFPVIAGLEVVWDHRRPPNQRLISVHLVSNAAPNGDDIDDEYEDPEDLVSFLENEDGTMIQVRQKKRVLGEEIVREKGGRVYRVITRNYMAEGYDGFTAMKDRKFIIDDDNGQIMSSVVRSFLLGSAYIFRHKQLKESHKNHLSTRTDKVIDRHRARFERGTTDSAGGSPISPFSPNTPYSAFSPVFHGRQFSYPPTEGMTAVGGGAGMQPSPSMSSSGTLAAMRGRHVIDHGSREIRDALHLARHEHMSEMDALDGKSLRRLTCADCGEDHVDPPTTNNISNSNNAKSPSRPVPISSASFLVNDDNRKEVRSLDEDLAIVSPLIDGRLRDVAVDEA